MIRNRLFLSLPFLFLFACAPSVSDEVLIYKSQEIVRSLKEIYTDQPSIEPVKLADFNLLDPQFYATAGAVLQKEGFVWVGDIELKHITRHDMSLQTCSQEYLNPEGMICAAVWQLHPGPKIPKAIHVLEFQTEFSDGHWLDTNNHVDDKVRPDPERVTVQRLPFDSVPDLLARHQKETHRYQDAHPTVHPVAIHTLTDVIAQQQRQAIQEAAYRTRIRGITEEELSALAPDLSKKDVRRLLEMIQRNY